MTDVKDIINNLFDEQPYGETTQKYGYYLTSHDDACSIRDAMEDIFWNLNL